MEWEIVIGIETHVQLSTESKIFSGASTDFGAMPNAHACEVDLALPGVLPVLNKDAVEKAMRFGVATQATVNQRSIFARKNYFYPDLPKGYQISQMETPVVEGGIIKFLVDGTEKTVNLTRAHLEEDAGKSLHEDFVNMSGIDLNRAGTPLLEIVSEPEMRSSNEAVEYAKTLHALVRWIGICDGNMQEGNFRCDANVSVRRKGDETLGTRREIKNLNSFKFLQQAIEYEARWQMEQIEEGLKIVQATVLFDADSGETRLMRTKEDAHDYRYFPDPDLLPLVIDDDWLMTTRASLPELPESKAQKYQNDLELNSSDVASLVSSLEIATYFEATLGQFDKKNAQAAAKLIANWMNGELTAALNRAQKDITQCPISPEKLSLLIKRVLDNTLSTKLARLVFEELWVGDSSVDDIISEKGFKQISDTEEIESYVSQVIEENPQQVADFKAGKEKALNSLVGQVMRLTKGTANPTQVNEMLKTKLS
ncbi:MAG: glutaminyl-tRNA synthase (glutamine-hydrolyzing) subunit B [Betaproteobacteria bacterium TMED22]|nr:MAG: glutaminyl-tRNA synthase (glutamine-hydrolyzing) subunit B [Betaproteobacteria bacterium TMED22]|tara:strand:+ start:11982 stop:13427 length:1446 start_codon:yes stop_codon:yes gene_type:complete